MLPNGVVSSFYRSLHLKNQLESEPMSARLTYRLANTFMPIFVLVGVLSVGSRADAKTEYATYTKTVVDGERIEAYFLIHTPKSFPEAMFLIEIKRRAYEPWEKSMGKASFERVGKNQIHLTVQWQSGPLKGEMETAEITNGIHVRWLSPEKGKSPHEGQTFDLNTTQMPENASAMVKYTRNSTLRSALDRL